ncbi:MAG: hypothetical protein WB689_30155, partial [Xanthobacteraceae bacterium]
MAYENEYEQEQVVDNGESERAARVYRDIDAYVNKGGKDLEKDHLALAQSDDEKEKIRNLWRRAQLALVGARFEALRPNIEEAKQKLAAVEPAKVSWRRTTTTNFFGPSTQPKAEPSAKDNGPRKAVVDKFVHDLAKRPAEIVFENWSAETKRAAKTKTLWPDAPEPPIGADRLTYPRGLLGHVVEYIYSTAQLPDRFMALAGALSACGKCLDRKVLGPTGNSTILYILLIAETGSGKQHIINCIRMILRAASMEETIVASGIASVQAIEEILEGRGEK